MRSSTLVRSFAVTAALTAGALVLVATAASAGAPLTLGAAIGGAIGDKESQTHAFTRGANTWHVFAAGGPSDTDIDLAVKSGNTTWSSAHVANRADFVAVDARPGRHSRTDFLVTATHYSGSEHRYGVDVAAATSTLTLPPVRHNGPPTSDDVVDLMIDMRKLVDVYNINVAKGEKFWVSGAANRMVFLVESDPAKPSTWTQTRSTAQMQDGVTIDGCTLITARSTGTHALVVAQPYGLHDDAVHTGRVLRRAQTGMLSTCPIKNWPEVSGG